MKLLTIVKHNPIVFALACLAAFATVFVSESSYWRSVKTHDQLSTAGAARMNISDLQQGFLDAETGQRGYLLTGRKEYLQPYHLALTKIDEAFRSLDRHYGGSPEFGEVVAKLHALKDTKLSEIALTIQLREEGKAQAATQFVLSNIGKEKMDAIRSLSRELQEREELTLAQGRTDMLHALLMQRMGVAVFSVLSLLALVLYMRQTYAFESQQEQVRRMVQDKRDRLEIEVAQRTAQLTELTHHLQTAREDERSRLARNLHDDLGALLTSAKLDAARIKPRLASAAPEALELLAHLVNTLNSSVALGRRIVEDLRPSSLGNLGLVATLEILTREFTEQTGIEVSCTLEPVALEATAELMVFRLVQEGLTNITKYASASHVWVSLTTREGQVEISVRDDGLGFDTSVPSKSAYGLMGMRFRVMAEGGSLTLESAPGKGTLIRATLPPAVSGAAQL